MTSTVFSLMDGQLPQSLTAACSKPVQCGLQCRSPTGEKQVGHGGPLLASQEKRCPRNRESNGIAEAVF